LLLFLSWFLQQIMRNYSWKNCVH